MATPAEIAAASNCYRCIPDQQSALLYVFATIAGVTPAQIQAGSACFKCISDPMSALVYLADQILSASGGGGGATDFFITTGTGPPASSPAGTSRWYVDLSNGATYYSDGVTWTLKA